jgi:hypothetical protein
LGVIRAAGGEDQHALDAFLVSHIDEAMFLVTNLRSHGLAAGGFASGHINATRFWLMGRELPGLSP